MGGWSWRCRVVERWEWLHDDEQRCSYATSIQLGNGHLNLPPPTPSSTRFGAPVNEIKEALVEYVYCTSGDMGHTHTLSSTWIPTGLFPQSSTIKFRVPVFLSKLVVECSGVRKMKLIIGGKGESWGCGCVEGVRVGILLV